MFNLGALLEAFNKIFDAGKEAAEKAKQATRENTSQKVVEVISQEPKTLDEVDTDNKDTASLLNRL